DLGKNKRKEPEKEAEDELVLVRPVEKSKVGGGLKKKIFKQSFTLTLEELLLIAPNFLQELQDLAEDDAKPLSRSQNSGRCDHRDFDGELHNNHGSGALGSIKRSLTYACPLGFVYITMGSTKLQLPLREISMNIMGIGGHSTPIVGLAEGINFSINTEDEKAANFFIARGKVYTVLGTFRVVEVPRRNFELRVMGWRTPVYTNLFAESARLGNGPTKKDRGKVLQYPSGELRVSQQECCIFFKEQY
ncbi:hypothetical protein PSTG_18109, partial [Puccinia striiformis f. sp. tritici PST-78]